MSGYEGNKWVVGLGSYAGVAFYSMKKSRAKKVKQATHSQDEDKQRFGCVEQMDPGTVAA